MHLRRIQLTEFRSYHNLQLSIPAPGLIAIGQNAAGKSSLLEAVRMLSTLRSPRSQHDRDVINWSSGEELGVAPFSRLVGIAESGTDDLTIELGLQRSDDPGGPLRKVVRINQQPRRVLDAVGTLKTVLFTPEDLDLIKRYEDAGVARLVFNLPPAKSDEVLPILDRCAALIRGA